MARAERPKSTKPDWKRIEVCRAAVPLAFPPLNLMEIEAAVTRLPAGELLQFTQWFEEYIADQWDRRIEADSLAGRFAAASQRAEAEFEAGRCKPL